MMNDVRSGADLVFAMGPPDIVVAGEAPVVTECRVPSLRVAKIRIPGDREERYAAVPQIRGIVGTRKPQNSQTDIRSKVRSLAVLAHASKADVAVHNKGRRKRSSVANGDEPHERMESAEAAVAVTIANGFAQAGLTMEHRLHGAVLRKNSVLRSPVPVHFSVKVVAVQTLRSRREKVVRLRGNAIHSDVCWRKQSDDLCCDGIDWDGGLVGKG